MEKLKLDSSAGGEIAGGARKKLEQRLGRSIVSNNNYLLGTSRNVKKKIKK